MSNVEIKIGRLLANETGRDFIVGDLHGMRKTLDCLLEHVNFSNDSGDRLFAVGDLIDRGPDSMGCLELLYEPWFYTVIGNHEAYLFDVLEPYFLYGYIERIDSYGALILNGGEWVRDEIWEGDGAISKRLLKTTKLLKKAPHVLVVGDGVERFNIVHGDLHYPGRSDNVLVDQDIDNDFAEIDETHRALVLANIVSGRKVAQVPFREYLPLTVEGLSPTYCGHTVVSQVRSTFGHIYLDTGACYARDASDGLTLMEHRSGDVWFLDTYSDERKVQHVGTFDRTGEAIR